MAASIWAWLPAALLVVSFGSFAWGMQRFFARPAGTNPGMTAIKLCSTVFLAIHFTALVWPREVNPQAAGAGSGLYVGALLLFWWAIFTNRSKPLSAAFSPDLPRHLVEQGPYRVIRHPFYSSYLVAWLAGVIASGQPWLVVTAVVMTALYTKAALSEEAKFSRSALAQPYELYRARTGLFLLSPLKLLRGTHFLAQPSRDAAEARPVRDGRSSPPAESVPDGSQAQAADAVLPRAAVDC